MHTIRNAGVPLALFILAAFAAPANAGPVNLTFSNANQQQER